MTPTAPEVQAVEDQAETGLVIAVYDEADEELQRMNMPQAPVFEAANELLSLMFAHSHGGVVMVSGAVFPTDGVPVFVASFPGSGGANERQE